MTIGLGLALSVALCYYVHRRQAQRSSSRSNYLRRQQLQLGGAQAAKAGVAMGGLEADEPPRRPRGTEESPFYQDYDVKSQRRHTPDASLVVQI